jgi:hypothetical protein
VLVVGSDKNICLSVEEAMKYNKKFSKRQRGGNLGQSYAFGGPITPGAPIGNTAEVLPMSSCMATQRFGEISYPTTGLGLPGMSGGKRRQVGVVTRLIFLRLFPQQQLLGREVLHRSCVFHVRVQLPLQIH